MPQGCSTWATAHDNRNRFVKSVVGFVEAPTSNQIEIGIGPVLFPAARNVSGETISDALIVPGQILAFAWCSVTLAVFVIHVPR